MLIIFKKYIIINIFFRLRKQFVMLWQSTKTKDLPSLVFSHGQLHEGLKILTKNNDKQEQTNTENIVYKEVFNNLPNVKTTSNIFFPH